MKFSDLMGGLLDGSLVPRFHSGIGMIQLYISDDVRLHVWHPDLPAKPNAFGAWHNHRYDLQSNILMGAVHDTGLSLNDNLGDFNVYSVVPYHKGIPEISLEERGVEVVVSGYQRYGPQETYKVPIWGFHETRTEGLTVTLCTKRNQSKAQANILAHESIAPLHGSVHYYHPVLVAQCFFYAMRKLQPWAIKFIEENS